MKRKDFRLLVFSLEREVIFHSRSGLSMFVGSNLSSCSNGKLSKLYSATSQPFDLPKSGKIAVKVINHFGDEVLKVYPVLTAGKAK